MRKMLRIIFSRLTPKKERIRIGHRENGYNVALSRISADRKVSSETHLALKIALSCSKRLRTSWDVPEKASDLGDEIPFSGGSS